MPDRFDACLRTTGRRFFLQEFGMAGEYERHPYDDSEREGPFELNAMQLQQKCAGGCSHDKGSLPHPAHQHWVRFIWAIRFHMCITKHFGVPNG